MYKFKQNKKRVLFISEPGFATTGYAVIGKELLSRLHKTGKYRLAEFATFVGPNDPRDVDIKWRFYCNDPHPNDHARIEQYNKDEANKLGRWRWDKVLLDFRPDYVCSFKDATMVQFAAMSSLRKYYYEIFSPSLDSHPQMNEWISYYNQCDKIIGYTQYSLDVIKKDIGNNNIFKVARPGANFSHFKQLDKAKLRAAFGIDPNSNILGMCGRNQIRKLFIELLKSFKIYLDKVKLIDNSLYCNTFLYLHCTLPDLKTWDVTKALIELNLANQVLFSYHCTACNRYFPNKFQDITAPCKYCGKTALLPRIGYNISDEELNIVYNIMDVYIQYSTAGAAEMPLVEAAAAGCNVMATELYGMGEIVKELGGIPLKVIGTPRDINVNADRCVMDNEFLADTLIKYFRRPKQINLRNRDKIVAICKEKYNWDKHAEIWEEAIDSSTLSGVQGKWESRSSFNPNGPFIELPDNLSTYEWTYEFLDRVLQEPNLKHTVFIDEAIKYASCHMRSNGSNIINWTSKEVRDICNSLLQNKIIVEKIRTGQLGQSLEDFIDYAEKKEIVNLKCHN